MAVTSLLRPAEQPKELARSPIKAVRIPMKTMATTKHAQPPSMMAGGTKENSNCQNNVTISIKRKTKYCIPSMGMSQCVKHNQE